MLQGYCSWSLGMVVEMVQGYFQDFEERLGKVAD